MRMINSVKTSSVISSILYQSNFDVIFICVVARNEKQCAIQEDEVRGVCSRATTALQPDEEESESHLSVYKVPVN